MKRFREQESISIQENLFENFTSLIKYVTGNSINKITQSILILPSSRLITYYIFFQIHNYLFYHFLVTVINILKKVASRLQHIALQIIKLHQIVTQQPTLKTRSAFQQQIMQINIIITTLYRLDSKTLATLYLWYIPLLSGWYQAEIKFTEVNFALLKRPINQVTPIDNE